MAITNYKSGSQTVTKYGNVLVDFPSTGVPVADTITIGVDNASAASVTVEYTMDNIEDMKEYINIDMGITNGNDVTGLANDATVYTTTVTMNGIAYVVSVSGRDAQKIYQLVHLVTGQLGGVGVLSIDGGDLKIINNLTGTGLTVVDGTTALFANLTGFSSIGSATSTGVTWINLQTVLTTDDTFIVTEYGPTGVKITATAANAVAWIKS